MTTSSGDVSRCIDRRRHHRDLKVKIKPITLSGAYEQMAYATPPPFYGSRTDGIQPLSAQQISTRVSELKTIPSKTTTTKIRRMIIGFGIAGVALAVAAGAAIILGVFFTKQTDTQTTSTSASISTSSSVSVSASTLTTTVLSIVNVSWSFDSVTTDSYGVYNGLLTNGAGYVMNSSNQPYVARGQALSLSSSSSQSFLVSSPFLDLSNKNFTIELWLYPVLSNSGDFGIIGQCQCSSCSNQCFYLIIRSYHLFVSFTNNDLTGNIVLTSNTWYHIAFVYNYNTREQILYVNGIQDNIKLNANAYQATSGTFEIGASNISTARNYFDGYIDNCQITTRVKSSTEILNDATLTAHYSFDLPNSNLDTGPNGLYGTILNAATVTGRVNQAMNFTGSSSNFQAYGFYQIGYGVKESQPFSVSLWFNTAVYRPSVAIQISPFLVSSNCQNLIGFFPTSTSTTQIMVEGSNYAQIMGPEIILNTWTHVSVTYSLTRGLTLYLNGTYFNSTGTSTFNASGTIPYLQVGFSRSCRSNIPNSGYRGLIDEIYVHSRELTQADVTLLANP